MLLAEEAKNKRFCSMSKAEKSMSSSSDVDCNWRFKETSEYSFRLFIFPNLAQTELCPSSYSTRYFARMLPGFKQTGFLRVLRPSND